MSTASPFGPL